MRFADDASGANTDREDLQRALAAVRAGLIDVLLVYRVDRLSRNLRDLVGILDELDQAGVVFRSATEPFDTSTPIGRMLVQMLGMFAQFERDTLIDRVIGGMERKAAKGKWNSGRRPFGYRVDKETHTLHVVENEAVIVRLVFDMYANDRLGTRAVATMLNARGHRTSTGGKFSGVQVGRVLNNRVYLGEIIFRGVVVKDAHEVIVSTEVWDRVRGFLEERGESQSHRAASGSDYLMTGRIPCPRCAKAMR